MSILSVECDSPSHRHTLLGLAVRMFAECTTTASGIREKDKNRIDEVGERGGKAYKTKDKIQRI